MGDEYNKFGAWEEAWQQAFEGSEHTPPNRVWQGLENSLMEQQIRGYKRKLLIYQWLAAASVMLLGIWAGWWLLVAQPGNDNAVAQNQEIRQNQTGADSTTPFTPAGEPTDRRVAGFKPQARTDQATIPSNPNRAGKPALLNKSASQNPAAAQIPALAKPQSRLSDQNTAAPAIADKPAQDFALFYNRPGTRNTLELLAISSLYSEESLLYHPHDEMLFVELTPTETNAVMLFPEQEPAAEIEEAQAIAGINKKEKEKEQQYPNGKLWLGASLVSNYFEPNMAKGNSFLYSRAEQNPAGKGGKVYTANTAIWDEMEESIPSFDFRIDASYRISPRWMLQSSIQYGSFKVKTYTGSYTDAITQRSYPLYYSNFNYERLQTAGANSRLASPINGLTSYNFLSVPVTVNYMLIERAFGVSLSSGLSSEVFVGGSIKDQKNNLNDYEISASADDSPFRKVHFNALMGVQLFYRAGPHHLITLEPMYRFAITDFHKRSSVFDSRPTQFGVAAGFKFILR